MGINVRGAAHHIQLRNNDIHAIENTHKEGNAHGIAIFGTKAAPLSDVLVDNNQVHHLKLGSSEAVVLNGNVKNFVVSRNKVHDNDNIGIDLIGFERTCTESGCVDQVRDGVCRGNQVYGITSVRNPAYKGERSAGGIYVDGGTNILIERNTIADCDIGIELASEHRGKATSNITVRGNLIYRSFQAGIALGGYDKKRGATTGCKIVNNTLFENGEIGQIYIQYDTRNNLIANNIVHAGRHNQFINNEYSKNEDNIVEHNLYFSNAGPNAGLWRWKDKLYEGWSAYRAQSGIDKRSRFVDPGLVRSDQESTCTCSPARRPAMPATKPRSPPETSTSTARPGCRARASTSALTRASQSPRPRAGRRQPRRGATPAAGAVGARPVAEPAAAPSPGPALPR